jgi:F0F1-type ATP synthase assembly protein I
MKAVTKSWKTSILGVILIGCGIAYVFVSTSPDYIIMVLLIGCGIGLLFSPDTVLDLLKKKSKEL